MAITEHREYNVLINTEFKSYSPVTKVKDIKVWPKLLNNIVFKVLNPWSTN